MKRNIKKFPTWADFKRELMKNSEFVREWKKSESQYRLTRNLIKLRLSHKLSQSQLAKKAKTKQPVISRLETGTVKPSFSLLERIARATNTRLVISFR
jgi:ribosome-binding protein aMBF1 (putative translation factor)